MYIKRVKMSKGRIGWVPTNEEGTDMTLAP